MMTPSFTLCAKAIFVIAIGSASATPISGTGFSVDAIAEKEGATPDDVTDYNGLARWVFVEEGSPSLDTTTATVTVPDSADRTFTTNFGTEFLLQPYDQPNLILNGETFTLDTPGSYSDLKFLIFGIGGNGADNFQVTVNFDDETMALFSFSINDWQGSRDYNATDKIAIARRGAGGWASYFGPGVFPREIPFELLPEDQGKVIRSIDFTLADRLAVAAVNGTSSSPSVPLAITDITFDPETQLLTLTWPKAGEATFIARYSPDLVNWDSDIADGLSAADDENPDDADQITVTFDLADAGVPISSKLFFRVEQE